jgi:hypothetical protein
MVGIAPRLGRRATIAKSREGLPMPQRGEGAGASGHESCDERPRRLALQLGDAGMPQRITPWNFYGLLMRSRSVSAPRIRAAR